MVAKQPMPGGMPMGGQPAAAQQGEEGNSPEQVRAAIMAVLQRAKALADQYGLDMNEMVAELGAGRGAQAGQPPPPAGGMPTGGGMPPMG